jgi:predicted ATPase
MMRLAVVGSGHGQQVLIEGESGCGKTRLLTEFLRRAAVIGTLVAAGECPPQGLSAQGDAVLQAGPLSPLRPLLQAIADLCRTQGEQTTQALLGSQLRVLASIEPALASVPGAELVPALQPLPMEAAKLRLLAAMTETLLALGRRGAGAAAPR